MIDFLKQKVTYTLVFVLTSLYLLTLSFQGFDMCDEGWVLSSFQQFFNAPESISYYFLYYLNALIGGSLNYFFDDGGILMFRLVNAFIIILNFLVLKLIFKDFLNPLKFLIIVCFCLLVTDYGTSVLDHNNLSSLLILTAVFFLQKHLKKEMLIYVLFSGFLIGLSFFARIANLTMLVLVLVFFIDFFYSKNLKKLVNNLFVFFVGVLMAFLSMYFVMKWLSHFDIFYKNVLENLIHGTKDPNHNHSLTLMFKTYFYQGIGMIKFLMKTLLISIPFYILIRFFDKNMFLKSTIYISYSILFVYLAYVDDLLNFSALIIISILISFFIDKNKNEFIFLNMSALSVFVFLPWGSDGGAYNLGINCLYLLIFIAIIYLIRFYRSELFKKFSSIFLLYILVLFSFIPLRAYRIYHTAYFDSGARHNKFYDIKHPLANVYTTKEKALIVNEFLPFLSKEIKQNETVYFHESLPMLHYLTNTKPYLDNSWPWIYGPENFNNRLIQKEKESNFRPTIIRQKCQPIGGKWTVYDEKYNDTLGDLNFVYNPYRTKYFEAFLKRNNYQIVWENDLFQILKISQKIQK